MKWKEFAISLKVKEPILVKKLRESQDFLFYVVWYLVMFEPLSSSGAEMIMQ